MKIDELYYIAEQQDFYPKDVCRLVFFIFCSSCEGPLFARISPRFFYLSVCRLSEQRWLRRVIFATLVLRSLVILVFGVLQLVRRQESRGSIVIEKIEVCRWLFLHWTKDIILYLLWDDVNDTMLKIQVWLEYRSYEWDLGYRADGSYLLPMGKWSLSTKADACNLVKKLPHGPSRGPTS